MVKEKRINVGISEDIHLNAKVIAILKNIPLGKYFEQIIEEAVEKDKILLKKMGK